EPADEHEAAEHDQPAASEQDAGDCLREARLEQSDLDAREPADREEQGIIGARQKLRTRVCRTDCPVCVFNRCSHYLGSEARLPPRCKEFRHKTSTNRTQRTFCQGTPRRFYYARALWGWPDGALTRWGALTRRMSDTLNLLALPYLSAGRPAPPAKGLIGSFT